MKIICLTQRPIQTLVLIYLLGKNNIFFDQIIYCSLNKKKNNRFRDEGTSSWKALKHQCNLLNIPFYKISDLNKNLLVKIKKIKTKHVISLVVDTIISKKIISHFKGRIYSSHEGILPNYRGYDCTAWSILNNEKYVGISLQKISNGIDDGKIVRVSKIKVNKFKNLKSFYKKLYYQYKLTDFKNLIINLKNNKKINFLKKKGYGKQYFEMHKDLLNIVKEKIR